MAGQVLVVPNLPYGKLFDHSAGINPTAFGRDRRDFRDQFHHDSYRLGQYPS